jgi:hypothetical protein
MGDFEIQIINIRIRIEYLKYLMFIIIDVKWNFGFVFFSINRFMKKK